MLSIIIPVYNRPQELKALLESLGRQQPGSEEETARLETEVIVVDDGSEAAKAAEIARIMREMERRLPFSVSFLKQENAGPGPARNKGASAAKGSWLLFLDSDCELPEDYLANAAKALERAEERQKVLLGGPDKAREDFSPLQQAIQYAMSSILTTGGIRGRKKAADVYYPRSFNMMICAEAFRQASGFSNLRFGEDLDLSMRIMKTGQKSAFVPTLGVYHKRRSTLRAFFRQVFNSGMARIVLHKRHPGSLKMVHLLPAGFTLAALLSPLLLFQPALFAAFWGSFSFILGLHSLATTGSLKVGALSVPASAVQLGGYGSGLMYAAYLFLLLRRPERYAFRQNFYG